MRFVSAPGVEDDGVRVDAWRLLRIVRVRRGLKALCMIAVVALPVWAGFTFVAEAMLSRMSSAFWAFDATIGPVFVIILAVFAGAFLALTGSALLGTAGRTAARMSPVFGRAPGLATVDAPAPAQGLYERLRRRGFVSVSAVLLLIVFGFVGVTAGWNLWPAWQANHGHGGPVVTIGTTATITSSTVSARGHRDYFLDTPYGPAIAEDHQPRDGQRWTVLRSDADNDKAYLVGGHDYLLIGAIVLFAAVAGAVTALRMARTARAEHAARAAAAGTLADSVAYLAAGNTFQLRTTGRRAETVTLTLRPIGARSAAAWLVRKRLVAATTALAIAAAAGIAIGLWQAGVLRSPPAQRYVTLPFLQSTTWEPDVDVRYTDLASDTELLHIGLTDVGAATARTVVTTSVTISARTTPDHSPTYAGVDIARIGSVPPSVAVRGIMTLQANEAQYHHATVSPLTDLPSGWQGVLVVTPHSETDDVELAGAADNLLIWISVTGPTTYAALPRESSELTLAISGQRIPRFAAAVAR